MSSQTDIEELGLSDVQFLALIRDCAQVKENAYAVYSKFRVGAALLTQVGDAGEIFSGCNVENASYGLTICAERSAICQAVAHGHRTFYCIAVTTDVIGEFCAPCGACRQTIEEFAPNCRVILVQPGFTLQQHLTGLGLKLTTINELLPMGFRPNDLTRPRLPNPEL